MDDKSDLLQYARDYAKENKDLYALLSISTPDDAKSADTVQRAWRKASLKHHPDKAQEAFDPEIWQLLERARDVLKDVEARAAYDAGRAAALRERERREKVDKEKRDMIEDLEARERGVKRKVGEGGEGKSTWTQAEKRVLAERTAERLEKRRRMREEAEARERVRLAAEGAGGGDGGIWSRWRGSWEAGNANHNGTAANTDTQQNPEREPEPETQQPQPEKQHAADEYDDRIADLERKLLQRKAQKAWRKAARKNNKARKIEGDDVDHPTTTTTAAQINTTTTDINTKSTPVVAPPTEEPFSIPTSTSIPTRQQQQPQQPQPQPLQASNPTLGSSGGGGGGVPSLMEKLRAAQREKERKTTEAIALFQSQKNNRNKRGGDKQ